MPVNAVVKCLSYPRKVDTTAVEVAKELGIHDNYRKNQKQGKQFHKMKNVDCSKDENEELRILRIQVATKMRGIG